MTIFGVGHLHTRYSVPEGTPLDRVAPVFDRLVKDELDEACHVALREALGGDQAVHLIRDLRHSVRFHPGEGVVAFADRWARDIAQTAIRSLASDSADAVRFSDWPDYLAHFIVSLLQGQAEGRWFYEPLEHYLGATPSQTLDALFRGEQEHLPAVLARLKAMGRLRLLLEWLDQPLARSLWRTLSGEREASQPASDHAPLMALAVAVAARLGLWSGPADLAGGVSNALSWGDMSARAVLPLPPAAREAWQTLQRRYLTYAQPGGDRWTPSNAALRLADILSFLAQEGLLSGDVDSLPRASRQERLEQVLTYLSWTDVGLLRPVLARLLGAEPVESALDLDAPTSAQPSLEARADVAARAVSHAQAREIVAQHAALRSLLEASGTSDGLHHDRGRIAAYAAAMESLGPQAHDAAVRLVQSVKALQRLLSLASNLTALRQALRHGDLAGARMLLSPSEASAQEEALRVWAQAAPRLDAELWRLLTSATTPLLPTALATTAPLAQAGLYLLVRPMLDIRMPSLVQPNSFPQPLAPVTAFSALVAAIVHSLAPTVSLQDEAGLVAGGPAPSVAGLRAWSRTVTSGRWRNLQRDLASTLIQQRVLSADSEVRLAVERRGGGHVLLLAPHGGNAWALGSWVRRPTWLRPAASTLLSEWAELTGHHALQVSAQPRLLDRLGELPPHTVVSPDRDAPPSPGLFPRPLFNSEAGLTYLLLAAALLRVWGQWLPGLSRSTPLYLWEQFIHRPGRLSVEPDRYVIHLQPKPLDAVLRMGGILDPVDDVPWLGKRLEFVVEE